MKKILLAPSILSADFGRLNEDIASVEGFVDMLHVDIMDGHFVPNISMGVPVVASIRFGKPMDIHLMIKHPQRYLDVFAKACEEAVGAKNREKSYLVVHSETAEGESDDERAKSLSELVDAIHKLGMKAGVALNPDTSLDVLHVEVLKKVDMVLCMTVFPGFGGQKFIAGVVPKIRELRDMMPELDIQVDGGINAETAKIALAAGANILVAGSYLFKAEDRKKAAEALRG